MKKLAATLCLAALATAAFAQGTVNFGNGTYSLVRTNATAIGGGIGNTAATLGGFMYGVFTANSAVTSAGNALELITPVWTFTGLYGTNTAVATGGRVNGGANVATTTGWPAGQTNSYVIAGWSRNLGDNWDQVRLLLAGGQFRNGNEYQLDMAVIPAGAFLGVSARGFGAAGGGASGLPAFSLFGTAGTGQGTPIGTGFDLFAVTAIPEPGTFALAGLGAAALLIFRRRK